MNVSQIMNSSGNQLRKGPQISHNLGVISEYKMPNYLENPGFLEKTLGTSNN
jgi:hypothetical protein